MKWIIILLLSAAPALADEMVVDDFSDGGTGWRVFTDQVMGGVSVGTAQIVQEGSTTFAQLTGDVSTANNGGFVQMRREVSQPFATDSTGLTLTVRGNGEAYFIHLRTPQSRLPWQYFQASFPTTADWTDVTLPWEAFTPAGRGLRGPLAPEDVRSIGVVAYGRDHAADLSVARIMVAGP